MLNENALNEQKHIIIQAKENIKLLNEFTNEIINRIKSEKNFIRTVIIL